MKFKLLILFSLVSINIARAQTEICCGNQAVDTTIQFCCNDTPHKINKIDNEKKFDVSGLLDLIKNISSSIPGGYVKYIGPGKVEFKYTDTTHDACCGNNVVTLHELNGSSSFGLGTAQGDVPVLGVIPGLADAGIRLKVSGSASVSYGGKQDCDKSQICGTVTATASGSFCVYASLLLGTIDVEGCASAGPSASGQICYDGTSFSVPPISMSIDTTVNYTVTTLFYSTGGSLTVGTINLLGGG